MGNKGMTITLRNKKYEIIKELGKGGFGRVILVENKSDNKFYAIKEIIINNKIAKLFLFGNFIRKK